MNKKFKKIAIAALAATAIASVGALGACGTAETTYTFEAEKATLVTDPDLESTLNSWYEGMYDWMGAYYTLAPEDVETASGGQSVGFFSWQNNTVTFTIQSDKAVTGAELVVCAASAVASYDESYATTGMDEFVGAEHDILQVNGTSVALSGTLAGSSADDADYAGYYNWCNLTATIDLVSGTNTISLVCDGTAINIDYITITAAATLTWTETNN